MASIPTCQFPWISNLVDDTVLRPLGGNEWGLFQISNERQGACRVAICGGLHGVPLSPDALQRAIDIVQMRHPLMSAVVKEDKKFYRSRAARAQVTYHQRANADSWQEVLTKELFFEPAEYCKPLLQVALVQNDGGSEQDFELVIAAEHCVCDGKSLSLLLHEVLTLVTETRPPTELALRVPPSLESCMSKQPMEFSLRFILLNLLVYLAIPLVWLFARCKSPIKESPREARRFAIRTLDSKALAKACKIRGTTVTGALLATILIATKQAQHEIGRVNSSVQCHCPIDLRPRYAGTSVDAKEMAYHVGVVLVDGKPNLPDPLDAKSVSVDDLCELARSMRQSLVEKSKYDMFLMAKMAAAGTTSIAARMKMDMAHFGFATNWGVSPLQASYGGRRLIDVVPMQNMMPVNSRQCLAMTTNGKLTLAFAVPDEDIEDYKNTAEQLADSVITNLNKMISTNAEKLD